MPYVPSIKTDGKSQDRILIDAEVEKVAKELAVTSGFALLTIYKNFFVGIVNDLTAMQEAALSPVTFLTSPVHPLARVVFDLGLGYGYEGAFLGELNYAITRLIQRVPQVMVSTGQWPEKNELRYWLYAITTQALTYASVLHAYNPFGIGGVFEDIKDEYKWRVNRPYEIAQILKSGDCYDTPYYSRVIEVVDEAGTVIGHQEVMLKRSPETLNVDVLPFRVVVQSQKALAAVSDSTGFAE
jgi:hypothetical protein